MGGLSWALVQSGQAFRLLTAPFLHVSVGHLIGNCVAFALAGYSLEKIVGRAWAFSIFATGALAGSAMSLALSAPTTLSVGASGAIMSMLLALFMVSFRLPGGAFKWSLQFQSLRIAVPALLPLNHGAIHVDYGAHLGGALSGAVLGFLLLHTWHDKAYLPPLRRVAARFALGAVACFLVAGFGASNWYTAHAHGKSDRIPVAERPHDQTEIVAKADALLAAYPRDPLAYLYAGMAKLQRGNPAAAEQQWRIGLAFVTAEPLRSPPALANTTRAMLALAILVQQRRPEAATTVQNVCAAQGEARPPAGIMTELAKVGLCPESVANAVGSQVKAAPR